MVPGVEFVGVVGGEEVAGAELEGVRAFEVVGWVVGAVGWEPGGLGVVGDVGDGLERGFY